MVTPSRQSTKSVRRRKMIQLNMRLTAEQKRLLDEAAAREHLPTTTWLRQLGLQRAAERGKS